MSTTAESLRSPEQYPLTRLTHREVQGLLANNRTTLILNKQSYEEQFGRDGKKFDPAICDPIRLVDVQQYDGRIIKGIQNGNHRTFAGEIYGQALDPDVPYLPTRNVTQQFSNGPLSPERFMEVLITPTKAHTEIAPERMAFITLTQWEQMVGPEIARKYSILAALTDTTHLEPYFVGSTPSDRELIAKKIEALNETIRKADYLPEELSMEILDLMSKDSNDAVLEEHIRRHQVEGLLFLPTVHPKFTHVFNDTKSGLTTAKEGFVSQTVRSLAGLKGKRRISDRNTILEVILNPTIPYRETVQIVTAENPKAAEKLHLVKVRALQIKDAYQKAIGPEKAVSPNARHLLFKFRAREEPPEEVATKVIGLVQSIDTAETTIDQLPPSEERNEISRLLTLIKSKSNYDTIGGMEVKLLDAITAAHAAEKRRKEEPGTDPTAQMQALHTENGHLAQQVTKLMQENQRLSKREQTLMAEVKRLQKLLDERKEPETKGATETVIVEIVPSIAASEPGTSVAPSTDRTVEVVEPKAANIAQSILETITYDPEYEGTKMWFGSHFIKGKAVDEETRHKTTAMINKHARLILRYLPEEWHDTLRDIQLTTGETGLDAIDKVLTTRLGQLIHDLALGATNDEFSYLAAASIIRFLQVTEKNIAKTDPKRASNLQQTISCMDKELQAFKPAMFGGNRTAYAALMQVLLFGSQKDENRSKIIQSMRGNRIDTFSARNKLAQLVTIQDPCVKKPEEAERILEELFRRHILGEQPITSSPDPDTSE